VYPNEDGGLAFYFDDVTDQKKREQELRDSRARLQVLYEESPDMIDLHDAEGRIINPNPRMLEKTGYAAEELSGMPVWELDEEITKERAQDLWRSMAPEDRRRFEGRYRRKDGSTFPVEVHLRRLDLGGEDRFMAISHDITEQKRREEKLKRRQEDIEVLYEATRRLLRAESQEAIYDRIHEVLREVFNYDVVGTGMREESVIRPVRTERSGGADMPRLSPRPTDGNSIAAQVLRDGETVVVKDTGSLENNVDYGDLCSAAGVPIGKWGVIIVGWAEGESFNRFNVRLIEVLAGYAALVLDRLGREERLLEAKEEAERASRVKSSFLANMSHEIRTPLTSILGFAEAIGEETSRLTERSDASELRSLAEFARLIEKSGQRLMDMLTGVLNLSKLEAGEMDLTPERVDLAIEAEDVAEQFKPQAKEAGINLRVEAERSPILARADENGIQIALDNLLSNGIKYTEEGGRVWVRAYEEDGTAILEVEDTGTGMNPEKAEELFEPFRQESEGMTREYEGTGLGLSVTKQVVEEMGGSVAVDTEKGEGTCFTVWLPLAEEERSDGEDSGRPER
jgi:PAS domain S-box-containing protein